MKVKGEIRVLWPQAKGHQDRQSATRSQGRGPEQTLPCQPQRERVLLTAWFWTSGLCDCETINSCPFKPLGLWECVTATTGSTYNLFLVTCGRRGGF